MMVSVAGKGPRRKFYLWGFPGIGKSHIDSQIVPGLSIVDIDSKTFQFQNVSAQDLHTGQHKENICPNPAYPQNYFEAIAEQDADIVLLNCHINYLSHFIPEDLLLVYPSIDLKEEYLQRYIKRGDNESFLEYMKDNFEDMVISIRCSPYHSFEVTEPDVYLQNLLDGGNLMSQFMTKPELTEFFRESMELGTIKLPTICEGKSPEQLAQLLFEGEFNIDLAIAKTDLELRKKFIEEERKWTERRGGLSRDELADKIMQGIVNGALGICYSEIAPYCHGYEVTFGGNDNPGCTRTFTNRWECYVGNIFDVPYRVADLISEGKQNNLTFGSKCGLLDINKMLQDIDDMEAKKITSFIPEKDTDFVRVTNSNRYPYHSSVASVMDVHAGKGLDGIVRHHYHGTYSTMTPVKQNSLVEMLVCLKGFCLDALNGLDVNQEEKEGIINFLKAHGTDISTLEKLQEWIDANPSKCAMEENRNRKPSLECQIQSAGTRTTGIKTAVEQKDKPLDPER